MESTSTNLQCPKPEGHNMSSHNIVLFMRFDNAMSGVAMTLLSLLISHNHFFTNRNVQFDESKDNTSNLFTIMYNNGVSTD